MVGKAWAEAMSNSEEIKPVALSYAWLKASLGSQFNFVIP